MVTANIAGLLPIQLLEGLGIQLQLTLPIAPTGTLHFVIKEKNSEDVQLQLSSAPGGGIAISGADVTITITDAQNKLHAGSQYYYLFDEVRSGITQPWLTGPLTVANR